MTTAGTPAVPLPTNWTGHIRSAVLHVIGLARYAAVFTRSWAANSLNARIRLKAENERLRQEVALQQEELRIKDARMQRIAPHRRPQYSPTERMATLERRMKSITDSGPPIVDQVVSHEYAGHASRAVRRRRRWWPANPVISFRSRSTLSPVESICPMLR